VGGAGEGEGESGDGFLWRSEAAPQPHHSPLTPPRVHCRRLLTEEQKRLYTKVAQYCNRSTDLIPMSFVLGTEPSPEPESWGPLLPPALVAGGCPTACPDPTPKHPSDTAGWERRGLAPHGWHSAPEPAEPSSPALGMPVAGCDLPWPTCTLLPMPGEGAPYL